MVAELTDFLFLSFLFRFERSTVEEARSYRRTLSLYVSSFKCIIICKGNGLRDRKKQCDDFVRSMIVKNVVARILTRNFARAESREERSTWTKRTHRIPERGAREPRYTGKRIRNMINGTLGVELIDYRILPNHTDCIVDPGWSHAPHRIIRLCPIPLNRRLFGREERIPFASLAPRLAIALLFQAIPRTTIRKDRRRV